MRLLKWSLLLLVLAALTGCAGSGPSVEGVWQKVTPVAPRDDAPAIKLLTGGHFAFGTELEQGRYIWAGGGTYTHTGELYTETVTYHSIPSLVGRTIEFKCIFRNGLWYHTADFEAGGEEYHIEEIWERLD